ncbi:MAG: 50S ribosomal protein L24 [Victivallaceae bacterium]
MKKYHVKKGDKVVVNAGTWKGEDAKIVAVLSKNDRVVLEFSNLSQKKQELIGKKTVKKSQSNPNGGLVERSVSVHVSNVTPVKVEKSE